MSRHGSHRNNRVTSLAIASAGLALDLNIFLNILLSWPSLARLESESDWEAVTQFGKITGIKLAWSLLLAYFAAASTVCAIGLVGILRKKAGFIRFYRDYSIADFVFCTFVTIIATYAAFRTPLRAGVCEELSRQPEIMRDAVEWGLSLENCENWFEQATWVGAAIGFILTIVRFHFLLALSDHYSHLLRSTSPSGLPHYSPLRTANSHHQLQRIYILPPSSPGAGSSSPAAADDKDDVIVYSPVALSSLSPSMRATATEAWVSRPEPLSGRAPEEHPTRSHHGRSMSKSSHHHHHHHPHRQHRRASTETGRIQLPERPGEGFYNPKS